ncbi:MAG: hypothetical protein B7X90_07060 [Novosphingobium sp. 17-62-19]|uniref:O-antigen ligase family protein n=1 Tax=Novosphingobium sp. 17-62-19 TaxID=1970406 RepID=UPI000BD783A8|nr:hypothetical protein [Novosphingobium sp. 17-62-19]OYX95341.1 MAG: hypothetical protein B7Y74_04535 [Novosphingobium sp. 35-62-5]OZA20096.1 MAG: hypothetical protein B7X90_07060 [Novosphingobium sp. 17-62-19]
MADTRHVIVPLILFWAILLPAGLAVDLGGFKLPPYRLVAMLLAPAAINQIMQRRLKFGLPDYLIIAGGLWGFLAMFFNSPLQKAIEGGGSFFIDLIGGYLVGRAYLTDTRRLRTFVVHALPGVIIIAIILMIEAISHQLLIAPLFPIRARLDKLYETRLGLLRARATFPHSMSAGIFMTSMLPLYYLSGLKGRTRWIGTVASLGAVFSLSSAAILTIMLSAFLIGYRAIFTFVLRMKERMIYLFYAAVAAFVFLEVFSGRGAIRVIVQYFTLSPETGYYRIIIWNYGTASVGKQPWFGIGDAPMERARWMIMETIDNHWLMLAVKYGLPATVLIGAGVIAAIWQCSARNQKLNNFDRATTMGVVFSLTCTTIVAFTTSLWANNIIWYMMVAGIACGMANQARAHSAPRGVAHNGTPRVSKTENQCV